MTIHVAIECLVEDLILHPSQQIRIEMTRPVAAIMFLNRVGDDTICRAETAIETSSKVISYFEAMPQMTDDELALGAPEPVRKQWRDMGETQRDLIGVMRWRLGRPAQDNKIIQRSLSYSLDGKNWLQARGVLRFGAFLSVPRGGLITDRLITDVQETVSLGRREPLAHRLLEEARTQGQFNSTSALLVAITAAEVGTKHCISSLVPENRWLLECMPSPPLVRLLIEYLPQLPGKCLIDGKVKAPPVWVLESLRNGVSMRNVAAHSDAVGDLPNKLAKVFNAVRDLLWLLDFYAGNEWAADFLLTESRQELGLPKLTDLPVARMG